MKTFLTMITVMFIWHYALAQVVIQSNKLPVAGDNWVNRTITDTTLQPGPSGPNQTWSFTNFFVYPNTLIEHYVSPAGTANDLLFPSSNLKVNSFFGGDDYYLKTSNDLQFLGTKSNSNEIIISNTQRLMTVPFAYGDSIANSPVTGNGFGYSLSGTIKVKADGWGSLSLYTGAFPLTLRVFTDMNLVLGAGTGIDTYIQIQRYTWYSQFYKAPVFQIQTINIDGPLGSAHQKIITVSTLATGIDEPDKNMLLFSVTPNPAESQANITIHAKKATELKIKVTDIIGKQWKSADYMLASGENKFLFELSDLPRGIYIFSAEEGTLVKKQRVIIE